MGDDGFYDGDYFNTPSLYTPSTSRNNNLSDRERTDLKNKLKSLESARDDSLLLAMIPIPFFGFLAMFEMMDKDMQISEIKSKLGSDADGF